MIFEIAKKEISDSLKNKVFLGILSLLFGLTIVSIILGTLQMKISLDNYNASVAFLQSLGKTNIPAMPSLNPLSASKEFVNYIGMVGALLAIVLGNASITKEYKSQTLNLILTRQVSRSQFLLGKLLGNFLILLMVSFINFLITLLAITIIAKISLPIDDLLRLIIFFSMSLLYLLFFSVVSMSFAALLKKGSQGILYTIILWLLLAFVFPQIGDTMDMDNQVQGGLFSSMGLTKDQETAVLQKFTVYETVRDSIEELSPTKHYERISFALLNIKPGFDTNTAFEVVGIKWVNFMGLTIPTLIIYLYTLQGFLKRETLYQNTEN